MREQRLYAESLDACQQAEAALGRPPNIEAGDWWAEWVEVQVEQVWARYWLAQWPEMGELVSRVKPVVEERGGGAVRLRFLWISCMYHLRKDRYAAVSDEALANLREAVVLSQEFGSLKTKIECRFELGFLHLFRRELDEAEENLLAARELAETSGVVMVLYLVLTYLTVVNRFRGQVDGVSHYALRAQEAAIAAQMPDYVAVAKANQAWLAWRRGDMPLAEQLGQEALGQWRRSPLVYPFQWQALWPLIAVARAQGGEDKVWGYAQALLGQTQQRLPDGLNSPLVAALQARADGQAEVARQHLDRAMESAREMGYL